MKINCIRSYNFIPFTVQFMIVFFRFLFFFLVTACNYNFLNNLARHILLTRLVFQFVLLLKALNKF